MKSDISLIFAFILLLFFTAGCKPKEKFNIKLTLEPAENYTPAYQDELSVAEEVLRSRLNTFGIEDEKIDITFENSTIHINIKDADTAGFEILNRIVTTRGKIEFWETYENSEVFDFLLASNDELRVKITENSVKAKESPVSGVVDPAQIPTIDTATTYSILEEIKKQVPLFSLLQPNLSSDGIPLPSSLIGFATAGDTSKVNSYLNSDEAKILFPRDLVFKWSRDPYRYDESGSIYELVALKAVQSYRPAVLDGTVIAESKVIGDKNSYDIGLDLAMNLEGAKIFARLTADNIDRCIAVVVDGFVVTYPRVASEIKEGKLQITGNFTFNEARALACMFNKGSGALPVKLKVSDLQINRAE